MAPLPDQLLSWLWSVLQTYRHAQVAYNDAAAALTAFPAFQPRTAVYTFENGQSALLLCIAGNLPVDFRGTPYKFPVELWIPQEYGSRGVGVIGYVKPGDRAGNSGDIAVRPGQHVGGDGRIYHPYLREWGRHEVRHEPRARAR